MSDRPAGCRDRLNLEDEIARIDRNLAEAQRLRGKTTKFVVGQLMTEGNLDKQERWILLLFVLFGVFGSVVIGVLIGLPGYMHLLGWAK